MIAEGKKRVAITVDREVYERTQEMLKLRGFPPGSMSFYLNCCVEQLDSYLHGEDVSNQMPLFEMEILRTDQAGALLRKIQEESEK